VTVARRLQLLALRLFRRLPRPGRRFLVRRVAPSFTVGSVCVIERADGAVLLLRLSYRGGWGLPGGLLKRGEDVGDAARREAREETGLDVELRDRPDVVVHPGPRRVDVVFRCHLPDGAPGEVAPGTAEVVETGWFRPEELPELQDEAAAALAVVGRGGPPRR
jgi:8-oxo-dGTP diphosphatase